MEEGRPAGGAGGFEPGGGNVTNAEGRRDVGRQVILADERRSGEIAEVECLHLRGANMPIFQALIAGLHGQGAQIAIRKGAERRFAGGHHSHWSHIISLARKLVPTFSRPRASSAK